MGNEPQVYKVVDDHIEPPALWYLRLQYLAAKEELKTDPLGSDYVDQYLDGSYFIAWDDLTVRYNVDQHRHEVCVIEVILSPGHAS